MPVDKFGRLKKEKGSAPVKGPPGVGFKVSENGDYDIDNKRLIHVAEPIEDGDAANKKFIDDRLNRYKCLKTERDSNVYDADGGRIANLGKPSDESDAVNLYALKQVTSTQLKDSEQIWRTLEAFGKQVEKHNRDSVKLTSLINMLDAKLVNPIVSRFQICLSSVLPVQIRDGLYVLQGGGTSFKYILDGGAIKNVDISPEGTVMLFDGMPVENYTRDKFSHVIYFKAKLSFEPSAEEARKAEKQPLIVNMVIEYPIEIKTVNFGRELNKSDEREEEASRARNP